MSGKWWNTPAPEDTFEREVRNMQFGLKLYF